MVLVLFVLVAVAVVVAVLAVATGRWPADPLSEPTRSIPDHGLPDQPRAADVVDVRFDTAARGYRMRDVDARLALLRVALAGREREVAALERDPGVAPPPAGSDALRSAQPGHRAGEG